MCAKFLGTNYKAKCTWFLDSKWVTVTTVLNVKWLLSLALKNVGSGQKTIKVKNFKSYETLPSSM